jgi:glycosyltransferase involved in cell wall biosynthesis
MSLSASGWPADTAVLLPAYRAAASLRILLPELLAVAPAQAVLVVDDGSQDGTGEVCAGLGIACVPHAANRGKGAALATGFGLLAGRGRRWAITMDADRQHTVEDLPGFLAATMAGPYPCLWIGRRAIRPGVMPLPRICSNTLTSAVLTLMTGQRIHDSQCGYRAYPLEALARVRLAYERFEMESEVILKLAHEGCPVRFIPIRTVYCGGPSHIAHARDTVRWVAAVIRVWWRLRGAGPRADPHGRDDTQSQAPVREK